MFTVSRRTLLKTSAAWTAASCLPTIPGWLAAQEAAPNPYADGILVPGEPAAIAPGSFTIAVLPDTQNYSKRYPESFEKQTSWLVQQRELRNLAFVLHLGDITNNNTVEQWNVAQKAMSHLDGQIPYAFVPGNHDYSANGRCSDRTTMLNDYLPVSRYRSTPTFGGTYDKEPEQMENSYHLFSAGGRDFLVLALEFGPRRDVVRWANEIAGDHPRREAILITHAYMYYDDTRFDRQKYGKNQRWNPHEYGLAKENDDVSDGQELWEGLVSRHENFILTLNGHVLEDGLGRMTSPTPGGREIPQMLVNYQMRPNGGDGWMRLMEFRPDGQLLVRDYSPVLQQRNASAQNSFDLRVAPLPAKA